MLRLALLAGLFLLAPPLRAQLAPPDPQTVRRCGAAYRFAQDGWIVVHVEGAPYERGVQHGTLLAEEIVDYLRTIGLYRAPGSAEQGVAAARLLTDALFLRGYDEEWLREMTGIADGASAAGARFAGRRLDLLDIATLSSIVEILFLDEGLAGLPTGLEGKQLATPEKRRGDHCSAFAATGPATKDGKIVFGHITMFSLPFARHFRIWLDVQPEKGRRVLMQTAPGAIWSGLDWYQNDAGILLSETTIGQTRFLRDGVPLASRARRAIQYSDTIDGVVACLSERNNGLYSNEWLIADTKTDEIAMLELGTAEKKLWRSSRDEWVGGTKGFYWGCNNERELAVRLEQIPSTTDRPRDLTWRPSDRDLKWLELYDAHAGKIDLEFGQLAFTTPPLAAAHSLDAKITTSALAGRMQSLALFGPPRGPSWLPSDKELGQHPGIAPLVSHDWSLLGPARVADAASLASDHLPPGESTPEPDDASEPPSAWHGTLLPAEGAELWLPIAFAEHERFVARERAETRELELFRLRAGWQEAARSLGRDVPLSGLRPELRRGEWHALACCKGALLLEAVREKLGDASYRAAMDAFGRAHAGKRTTSAELMASLPGSAELFTKWLTGAPDAGAPVWSIRAFEREPEQALIVYGTRKEAHANREAAELLQRAVAARWHNHRITIRADARVSDDELGSHHVVLVGRPATNAAADRLGIGAFPVRFAPGSFRFRETTCAHETSAIVAAGANPKSARHSLVIFAGNSSEATRAVVQQETEECEAMLCLRGRKAQALVISAAR